MPAPQYQFSMRIFSKKNTISVAHSPSRISLGPYALKNPSALHKAGIKAYSILKDLFASTLMEESAAIAEDLRALDENI